MNIRHLKLSMPLLVPLLVSSCGLPPDVPKTIQGTFTPKEGCAITSDEIRSIKNLGVEIDYSTSTLNSGPRKAGGPIIALTDDARAKGAAMVFCEFQLENVAPPSPANQYRKTNMVFVIVGLSTDTSVVRIKSTVNSILGGSSGELPGTYRGGPEPYASVIIGGEGFESGSYSNYGGRSGWIVVEQKHGAIVRLAFKLALQPTARGGE